MVVSVAIHAAQHSGLQEHCTVCFPVEEQASRRQRREFRKKRGAVSYDSAVRKQVEEELGEEPQVLTVGMIRQKFGTAQVRVDKKVALPKWKLKWLADRLSINSTLTPEGAWQKRQAEWQKSIPKFLIPRYQQKQETRPQFQQRRPPQQGHRRDTRTFPANSGRTQTGSRQS